MTGLEILVTAGCAAGFYFVLCNRIIRLTHPMRMEMAEIGERLLNSGRLSKNDTAHVMISLDNAYCTICAWAFVVALPIAAVAALLDWVKERPEPFAHVPEDLRAEMGRFARMSLLSTLVNSPLAAFLFAVEFAVMTVLFLPTRRILRELFSMREIVANHMPSNHKHA